MNNIVLEVVQIRLIVGQIRLKVDQLDHKLKSEIAKVNTKLDVIQEPRIVSRYPRAWRRNLAPGQR